MYNQVVKIEMLTNCKVKKLQRSFSSTYKN